MTPLAGFVLAIIAGWITRDARRAAAVIIIPFLALTALQTYGIADGRGVSPPDTVWPLNGGSASYYVVQVLIMAAVLGVGMLLGTVRAQRAAHGADTTAIGRRTTTAATVAVVLTAAYGTFAWLDSTSHAGHHSSTGSPPVQGLIGMGVLILSLIVLGGMAIAGRRRARLVAQPDAAAGACVEGSYTNSGSGMRLGALAAGAALMLGTAGGVVSVHAAPAVPAGVLRVYETGTGGPTNSDVLTGVIGDHGVDNLNVLDHGNANKLVLTKGSFEINVSKLGAHLKVVSSDHSACTLILKGTAPMAVSHGTGKYQGIHGTLQVTVVNAVVFPKKPAGGCVENIAKAVVQLSWATGSGHVSF
jgi:uncharacterized membrane protein